MKKSLRPKPLKLTTEAVRLLSDALSNVAGGLPVKGSGTGCIPTASEAGGC